MASDPDADPDAESDSGPSDDRAVLLWGGTVGFGLGAAVDVIVFHMIFQHHHLLSGYVDPGSYAGFRENVYYDGLFLAAMLAVASLGTVMLWRTSNGTPARFSSAYLAGSVLVGTGVFNVFDGTVDHYVLGLHDVVHGTETWNPHWIAASLAILGLGVGLTLVYRSDGAVPPETSTVDETE